MRILIFTFLTLIFHAPVMAQEASDAFRSTDYPLPRFVSLRSGEAYVRSGPGQKYPVQWIFKKAGLPVEIVLEYDAWRKIKDFEGDTGWVHKSLLSGKRAGIVKADVLVSIYKKQSKDSSVLVKLNPMVVVKIEECTRVWCAVNASGYKGWLEKSVLWGVYGTEEFD